MQEIPTEFADDTTLPIRIASLQVDGVELVGLSHSRFTCRLSVRGKNGEPAEFVGEADSEQHAVVAAVSLLCTRPLTVESWHQVCQASGAFQCSVVVTGEKEEDVRSGAGHGQSSRIAVAMATALIRAASHAALLKADFRANNQKELRRLAGEVMLQWDAIQDEFASEPSAAEFTRVHAEGLVLDYFNRVASAAVITATNHPRPDTILRLFDTSAWLFDADGQSRDSYTETDLWHAWYPGVLNDQRTVQSVIDSLPAAPATAIPWVVRLFENPRSWIRFRGAIDLDDHDVMHVLLGRGLQDQDEAFVLGFAMGTAKRVSRIQAAVFKLIMTWVYPEPYRIPRFLLPAFDLGVRSGKATGKLNLYKQPLEGLREMSVRDARVAAGIDIEVLLQAYRDEQEAIPFTIASLRLP
ncbi:hypothetical protein [Neorhodopirellula lusitana]|uniref:hypothetical protein n=1 Tax=Neorhodopirellula lusitana TaxID=445327 RepID=UPI00384FA354